MRRVGALYINEMIKISRKISVWIILGILVVGVVGVGALIKFTAVQSNNSNQPQNSASYQKENMEGQINSFKTQLEDIKTKEKSASASDLESLKAQEAQTQNQIDMYQFGIDNNISLMDSSYRANAVNILFSNKLTISQMQAIPTDMMTSDQKDALDTLKSNNDRLEKIIKNSDFKDYIAYQNEQVKADKSQDDAHKAIETESNDLRLKYDVTGGTVNFLPDYREGLIEQIANDRKSLLDNIDYSSQNGTVKPLTSEGRDKATNDIAVSKYKLENKIGGSSMTTNYAGYSVTYMTYIGLLMLVILMMILAGGAVSQEISTGSIKSLIIAPVKRYKIFVAKVLSLLTVVVAGGLLLYLIETVVFAITFGIASGTPYIFATGGAVQVIPFLLYNLAMIFVKLTEVVVFMFFALMLSILTRNTAVAVGITIAVYFSGGIINTILAFIGNGEWAKFVPFVHLDISSKVFPNDVLMQQAGAITSGSGLTNSSTQTSLTFSLCYLGVMLLCMIYTSLDSFNRRDLK